MHRIKKLTAILLCAGIMCLSSIEGVFAAQKPTGYHSIHLNIESPKESQQNKTYARSYAGYYNAAEQGLVTLVKNQGNTELCWAFGLASLGETSLIKQKKVKKNVDYSEKHLGYFMYNRTNDALNNTKGDATKVSGNWKYSGGNAQLAMITLTGWYGLANESTAPFNTNKWTLSSKLGQKDAAILKNGFFLGNNPSINVVKSYIKKYGSVVVAYHAPETTEEDEKFYDRSHKSYNCTLSGDAANHIVTIVGWNDNYSRDKFGEASKPKRNGAWIIKNSWGNKEEDKGYTYISYEDRSMCEFLSGQFVKSSTYKYNYFYDGSANPSAYRLKKGQQIANIYTAKKGTKKKKETLKAVNVVTMNPNVKYSIQIYKNPKKGKPTSGKKLLKRAMTGTIKEAGTHTIDLKQKVRLVKGEKFSIVIKIGSTALIGCDHSDNFGWIRFVNKTAKGQSYVCLKGNKWYDMYSARLTMRIKAYTTT